VKDLREVEADRDEWRAVAEKLADWVRHNGGWPKCLAAYEAKAREVG
jgi:hypothetical protein